MNIPDFLRSYGEILGGEDGATLRVFAILAGLVLLLFAWFIVGALLQGIGSWWKRSHRDSLPRPPSAGRGPAKRNGDRHPAHPR